jgi:hypothetical protein
VYDRPETGQIFTGLADGENRRPLGRSSPSPACSRFQPVGKIAIPTHFMPDHFLGFPGILPPKRRSIFESYISVPDIDPYRSIRLSLNGNAIPSGEFKHGPESSTEVASGEPFDRIRLYTDPLNFRSAGGTGSQGAGQGRRHNCDHVTGIKSADGLIVNKVPKQGGADTVPADPGFIIPRVYNGKLPLGQIDTEYFPCVSVHKLILSVNQWGSQVFATSVLSDWSGIPDPLFEPVFCL